MVKCRARDYIRGHVTTGKRDGAVVRALASHQCVPGSIPGPDVVCGLSLSLVFFIAPRGFSTGKGGKFVKKLRCCVSGSIVR